MKKKLLTILFTLTLIQTPALAQEMKITCYCPESCPGDITASGKRVRDGIAAVGSDHFGDCAMIYTLDGEFLGYFECVDKGGTDGIRNGYVIDIWKPNLEECKEVMKKTGGKVSVEFIKSPKG